MIPAEIIIEMYLFELINFLNGIDKNYIFAYLNKVIFSTFKISDSISL